MYHHDISNLYSDFFSYKDDKEIYILINTDIFFIIFKYFNKKAVRINFVFEFFSNFFGW